jgi:hypothetical protein
MAVERIHIHISAKLKEALDSQVKAEGYGPRGKSKWIRESVLKMDELDERMTFYGQGDSLDKPYELDELITVSPAVSSLLKDMLLRLRVREPASSPDMSVLLRSAIRYRLQHPDFFIAKPSSSSSASSPSRARSNRVVLMRTTSEVVLMKSPRRSLRRRVVG